MKKKQLLVVLNHLTIGGVQKTLITASKNFDYEKYDVTIYLRRNRTDLLPYIDKRAKVIVNNDPNHYYRKPFALKLQLQIMIAKLLKDKSKVKALESELTSQICHATMSYEQKTHFNSLNYDIAIAYVHGYPALLVDKYINAKKKIIFFRTSTDELHEVHEKIIANFDKVMSLMEEQKALIKTWYPIVEDRIFIVENYIDKEAIIAQSKEKQLPKYDSKYTICSCGRFAMVKGFDLAVEAAKELKERGISFLWYFVGDGSDRTYIEELIKKYGLTEEIVLTGMQKNPYPYMAACDVYVQPSREEALVNTVNEAQKLCKPVVSTKTLGGLKFIDSEEKGLLCDFTGKSIADGIERILRDEMLRKKIENNLQSIDYSFQNEKYKEQWRAVLED